MYFIATLEYFTFLALFKGYHWIVNFWPQFIRKDSARENLKRLHGYHGERRA